MSARPKRLPNGRDAKSYIGEMSSALAELARAHRLASLSYLLELAQMEAERGRARQGGAEARRRTAAQHSPQPTDPHADQATDHGG
jgi:hypothetical protein